MLIDAFNFFFSATIINGCGISVENKNKTNDDMFYWKNFVQ